MLPCALRFLYLARCFLLSASPEKPTHTHAQAVLNLRRGHPSAAQSCCGNDNPASRFSAPNLSHDGGDSTSTSNGTINSTMNSTSPCVREGDTTSPPCDGVGDAKSTCSDDSSGGRIRELDQGAAPRVKLNLGLLFAPQLGRGEQERVGAGGGVVGVGDDGATELSALPSAATC